MESNLSLKRRCELLKVNRSNVYYEAIQRVDDTFLCNRLHEIYTEFPYYGYRKITVVLRDEDGTVINHKRVQRLMQLMGLKAIYPGPKTSLQGWGGSVYPYLLKGLDIVYPNQVWSVDITYIRLPIGMVYLFALIDWYSRFIVGWTLATTMTSEHGIEALNKALLLGTPDICNADQGSQFTGYDWIAALTANNIKISHDSVGRFVDNIRIERFWRTLKYEDLYLKHYSSIKELRMGIEVFIQHYNYKRPHQALMYAKPADLFYLKDNEKVFKYSLHSRLPPRGEPFPCIPIPPINYQAHTNIIHFPNNPIYPFY